MSDIVIPSDQASLKKIKDAMKEMTDCMIRISAERELMKDIVENLSEEFEGIPKKYFNQMAKVMYKNSFDKVTGEMSDFETLYQTVVAVK